MGALFVCCTGLNRFHWDFVLCPVFCRAEGGCALLEDTVLVREMYHREHQRVRAGGPFQPQIPELRSSQGCELQPQDVSSSPAAGGQGGPVQW